MQFKYGDLYPSMSYDDTSNQAQLEPDVKEKIAEDSDTARKTASDETPKSKIIVAILIAVSLVIFLGAGGGIK